MRIAYFGTGDFSTNILSGILKYDEIDLKLCVSQIDKPVGRNKNIIPTKLKSFCLDNDLKILQPEKIRKSSEFFDELKNLDLDFIVVVAYGKIIPNDILDIPRYGCINLHGSILPKYRGASPIQESIKAGDKKTGLTVMYMSEGMDEGDILTIKEIDIDILDKTQNIFKKFELFGPKLLVDTLNKIISGDIKLTKQDEKKATFCTKITKQDGEIFFNNNSSINIYNKYRAYSNWPGIYTYYNGKKFDIIECKLLDESTIFPLPIREDVRGGEIGNVIKINKKNIGVVCFDKNILILKRVKLEGKKEMDIISFINGNKDFLNYNFNN